MNILNTLFFILLSDSFPLLPFQLPDILVHRSAGCGRREIVGAARVFHSGIVVAGAETKGREAAEQLRIPRRNSHRLAIRGDGFVASAEQRQHGSGVFPGVDIVRIDACRLKEMLKSALWILHPVEHFSHV